MFKPVSLAVALLAGGSIFLLTPFAALSAAVEEENAEYHGIRREGHERRLAPPGGEPDCNPATETCDCMGDVAIETTQVVKNSPSDFGCTSNDVRVADTNVTSVNGQTLDSYTCTEGELINVALTVDFVNGAASRRSDIGLWLSQDGGDAETGDCKFTYFPVIEGDLPNADDPADTCGDLIGGAMVPGVQLDPFILTCTDDNGIQEGLVNIGSCIGWKVPGADKDCDFVAASFPDYTYAAATLPATKSKCRCEILVLPITILRPPTIAKTCDGAPTLSDDEETVVYDFTVTITNPNPDPITSWSVVDTPEEFDTQLNFDNNGALVSFPPDNTDNVFNPTITLTVPEANVYGEGNPFSDTVTLSTEDYPDVTATAECPPFTYSPAILNATIDCDTQGTTTAVLGTQFIVTQTFTGSVCNTGVTKAKNVEVEVVDGNNNILFSDGPLVLLAGVCVDFTGEAGSVTAGFTNTCDATFSATVTGTGKDIADVVLTPATADANCPVCDCGP